MRRCVYVTLIVAMILYFGIFLSFYVNELDLFYSVNYDNPFVIFIFCGSENIRKKENNSFAIASYPMDYLQEGFPANPTVDVRLSDNYRGMHIFISFSVNK